MEIFFYVMMLMIVVFVFAGITHRLAFSWSIIKASDLPHPVSLELSGQFGDFKPKIFRVQKQRNRFLLEGSYQKNPGRLTFQLTPDNELSAVEYRTEAELPRFVFRKKLSGSQVPPKVANRLTPLFGSDKPLFETSIASMGMFGNSNVFRINVDSQQFAYQFDVGETGELFYFRRKDAA